MLHSFNDEPAVIKWQTAKHNDGWDRVHYHCKLWYHRGVPGRENGLHTSERYNDNGVLVERRWENPAGQIHRDGDLPAVIRTENRETFEMWYKNGVCHREGAPAIIGDQGTEMWLDEGVIHRLDGPAVTTKALIKHGTYVKEQQWRINGDAHNLEGPAIVRENGEEEYWVGGLLVDQLQFMALQAKYGDLNIVSQFNVTKDGSFGLMEGLETRNVKEAD